MSHQFWLNLRIKAAIAHPIPTLGMWSLAAFTAIAPFEFCAPAQAAVLSSWNFDPDTRQLEITVPQGGTTPRYFLLAQPARIVLDLPDTQLGSVPEQQTYSGAVRQIRVGQFQPNLVRIVIELAPDTVLASEQVELRQVDGADSAGSDRWVLRPLLAGESPSQVAQTPAPEPISPPAPQSQSAEDLPTEALPAEDLPRVEPAPPPTASALPPLEPGATELPIAPSSHSPSPSRPETLPATEPAAASDLPPLEPGALELPVDMATEDPGATSDATLEVDADGAESSPVNPSVAVDPSAGESPADSGTAVAQPEPPATAIAPPQSDPAPAPDSEALADPAPESSSVPFPEPIASPLPPGTAALPPATFMPNQPVTVRVPSLDSAAPPSAAPTTTDSSSLILPPVSISSGTSTPSSTVRVPSSATAPAPASVPPAPPTVAASEVEVESTPERPTSAIALPTLEPSAVNLPVEVENPGAIAANTDVLMPSGTILKLQYPGQTNLTLEPGLPRQEVLLLSEAVRDRAGRVIAPAGSPVIGRFETGSNGSQFIAQAITLQGRNVLLKAESGFMAGDRLVSDERVVRNSALGALALTVLGGFTGIGLLGGLAAGAATTYVTAPQPAVIQPNQIVEVRLFEDVPRQF